MMTTLTPAARALGEQPAFPVMWEYAKNETGMTYRQWLIGQALVGSSQPEFNHVPIVRQAISLVDTILNAIASEQQPEQPKPEPSRDLRTVAGGGSLTLEVGKTYRDRGGDVCKITNYEPSEEDPFVDASGETYTEDGFWDHPHLKSKGDLIELVEGE